MSNKRLLVRCLLIVILIAVCLLAYRMWRIGTPEYYWDMAAQAMDQGEADAAVLYLQNYLKQRPNDAVGHEAMADALVENAGPDGRPAPYGAIPAALDHLAKAAELRPDDVDLQRKLFTALAEAGKTPSAVAVARRLEVMDANTPHGVYLLAMEAESRDDLEAATERMIQALGEARPPVRALAFAANVGSRAENEELLQLVADQASERFLNMSAESVDQLDAREGRLVPQLLQVAISRAPVGDDDEAYRRAEGMLASLDMLQERGAIDPRVAGLFAPRCMQWLARHSIDKERETPFLEKDAETRTLYEKRHKTLVAKRRELTEKGLAVDPGQPSTLPQDVADFYMTMAEEMIWTSPAGARRALAALASLENPPPRYHFLAGQVALREGRNEDALRHFLAARNTIGNSPDVRAGLLMANRRLKRWDDAAALARSLQVPESSLSPQEAMWIVETIGSLERAQLMELEANAKLGKWDDVQHLLEAIHGETLEAETLTVLGQTLVEQGRLAEAKDMLSDASERFPDHFGPVYVQTLVMLKEGRGDEAVAQVLEAFATSHPKDRLAQLAWAQWLVAHNEGEKALPVIEATERLETMPEAQRKQLVLIKVIALLQADRVEEAATAVEPLKDEPRFKPLAEALSRGDATGAETLSKEAIEEGSP